MATVVSTQFISLDRVAKIDPDWHFPHFDEAMGKAVSERTTQGGTRRRTRRLRCGSAHPDRVGDTGV